MLNEACAIIVSYYDCKADDFSGSVCTIRTNRADSLSQDASILVTNNAMHFSACPLTGNS